MKSIFWFFLLVALTAVVLPAGASLPYTAFQGKPDQDMSAAFMSFHPLEHESSYTEDWNFYVQSEDGTLFSASLAVTNLGLHTFDCMVNATLAPRGRPPIVLHKEYRRNALQASTANYDVRIANNHAWGASPLYHLELREDNLKADLEFRAELPPYRRGDGTIWLDPQGKKMFATGMLTPLAHVRGTITAGGQTYTIKGPGFHEHTWQTIKMTDLARQSSVLRLYDGDLTLILKDIDLSATYGGAKLQVGLLGEGDRLLATSNHYELKPLQLEKEPGSPYLCPQAFRVDFAAGTARVSGTVKVTDLIQNLDLLKELSWPVRVVVKALYGKPWLFRMRAHYDLDVTLDGRTRHISGETAPLVLDY